MNLTIEPHVGVGALCLGMHPEDVRRVVGKPYETFLKVETDPFPTDFFESEGIFAFYDAQGRAEAFEFCEPAHVFLRDMNLLSIPYREVVRFLRGLDPGIDTDEGGCTSLELGLAASVPTEGKPSKRPPATVIVFRRGYYDEQ